MSVDTEWSEDHMSVMSLCTQLLEVLVENVNLRPGGALGESGGISVGKGGDNDVKSQQLQGCSPHLCRLRADGLVPESKY
jgi:hypothetical protein